MFQHWHQFHIRRQLEHEEHIRRVQQKTIEIAKIWKYKAQETRGQLLQAQIQTRHVRILSLWLSTLILSVNFVLKMLFA